MARFLWAWPDMPPYSRPAVPTDPAALLAIYSRLDGLGWDYGEDGRPKAQTLPLDADAADLFEAFERESRESCDDASRLLKSFVGKLSGLVLASPSSRS